MENCSLWAQLTPHSPPPQQYSLCTSVNLSSGPSPTISNSQQECSPDTMPWQAQGAFLQCCRWRCLFPLTEGRTVECKKGSVKTPWLGWQEASCANNLLLILLTELRSRLRLITIFPLISLTPEPNPKRLSTLRADLRRWNPEKGKRQTQHYITVLWYNWNITSCWGWLMMLIQKQEED